MAHMKVITGPMFSGKTEELIRILHRSEIAGKNILVLKPRLDNRAATTEIASRAKQYATSQEFKKARTFPAFAVSGREEAIHLINVYDPAVLGIDEAQFFETWMIELLEDILKKNADKDLTVLVAGLDMDAWGKPFGIMPHLLAIADEVQKETAICFVCKKRPGTITQKFGASTKQVEVGDNDIYEARCRFCHEIPQ